MPTCQSNLVGSAEFGGHTIFTCIVLHSTGSKNYFALLFIPYLDST